MLKYKFVAACNRNTFVCPSVSRCMTHILFLYIAHLRQQCHNSKSVTFQEKRLKVLQFYTFLWVQRRHNCFPAASFTNCVMTLCLLKVHLQTFFL